MVPLNSDINTVTSDITEQAGWWGPNPWTTSRNTVTFQWSSMEVFNFTQADREPAKKANSCEADLPPSWLPPPRAPNHTLGGTYQIVMREAAYASIHRADRGVWPCRTGGKVVAIKCCLISGSVTFTATVDHYRFMCSWCWVSRLEERNIHTE